MKFAISQAKPQTFKSDIISIGCYEREDIDGEGSSVKRPALIKHADGGLDIDKALKGTLSKQIAAEKFTGEKGTSKIFFTAGRIPAKFIQLVGLGPRNKCDLDVLREAGGKMAEAAKEVAAHSLALVLERGPLGEDFAPSRARAIVEGIILGSYEFKKYKSSGNSEDSPALATFLYSGDAKQIQTAIDLGQIVANETCFCRDLVNMPPSDLTPRNFAKIAADTAKSCGLACKVLTGDVLIKEKLTGLIAVSRGSSEPCQFVALEYIPEVKDKAHLIMIGKGVTFDSGGISLKQVRGMEAMKQDMGGAAAVLCAMRAIAALKPPVSVTAYMPITENMPDGSALRPGDILTMRNGKTVEIITSDAEGRLILADALVMACDKKPDAVIDIATLTGTAAYSCGDLYSIMLGNDQKLIDRLKRAAESAGEKVWQLPLEEEYRKDLTSGIADLKNVGKNKAMTIGAGLFLNEFVNATPWVHVDTAASVWADDPTPLNPKGATGAFVRTLISFAMNFKKGTSE